VEPGKKKKDFIEAEEMRDSIMIGRERLAELDGGEGRSKLPKSWSGARALGDSDIAGKEGATGSFRKF